MKNLKKIKGDASFREFFRKKNKNFSSIIVFAVKEKSQNLINYDAINRILLSTLYSLFLVIYYLHTVVHFNYSSSWY